MLVLHLASCAQSARMAWGSVRPPLGGLYEGEREARGRSPGDAGWEREARAQRRRRGGTGGAEPQEVVHLLRQNHLFHWTEPSNYQLKIIGIS